MRLRTNAVAVALDRARACGAADATAVICGSARHTYRDFESRCRRLVNALAGLGVNPGDRVAVVGPNCHRVLELYVAVPAGHFIFVPINPRLEAASIRGALADSGASVLFTDRQDLTGPASSVFSLSSDYEQLISGAGEASFAEASPGTVASLTYTGGTTGGPKGVMLTHGNLAANAGTWLTAWPFSTETRWALIAPMSHLAGTNAVLTTIAHGGCHVVLPAFAAGQALDLIEAERVTATLIVPTMLAAMAEEQSSRPRQVGSLTQVSHGGAPIAAQTLRRACAMFPAAEFMEIYGTTETAPNITFLTREERLLDAPEIHSCGRPIAGIDVRIAGPDGEALPAGQVGEVTVRGPVVMAGYWNKPEATASALAGGWYHTGDVGYADESGYLYLRDRMKDVINSGGENVYSTELEEVLYRHPLVLEAAVFGIPDRTWGEAVHAVVRSRGQVEAAELIEHCRQHLAGFKVPKAVTFTDEPLPKSAAGKILKRTLREPYWATREARVSGA